MHSFEISVQSEIEIIEAMKISNLLIKPLNFNDKTTIKILIANKNSIGINQDGLAIIHIVVSIRENMNVV